MAPVNRRKVEDQTRKRCWNCRGEWLHAIRCLRTPWLIMSSFKARKTACDKSLPSCLNCQEKGQVCLGYGLKLSWPRENDCRRFVREKDHYMLPVNPSALEFVNTSSQHIDTSHRLGMEFPSMRCHSRSLWQFC